jgi:hypothetical protein
MRNLYDLLRSVVAISQDIGGGITQESNATSLQCSVAPVVIASLGRRAFVIIVTVDLKNERRFLHADLWNKDCVIHAPNARQIKLWH